MKRSVAFCLGLVLPIISSAHAADWPFTNKQAQAEATNANCNKMAQKAADIDLLFTTLQHKADSSAIYNQGFLGLYAG
jgi:hypothetical protein